MNYSKIYNLIHIDRYLFSKYNVHNEHVIQYHYSRIARILRRADYLELR